MDAVNHVNHVNQVGQPQHLRLIACPCLAFEHGKIDRYVPEGLTVAGHLCAIGWEPEGLHERVFIDGVFIQQAQWEYAVPRAGQASVTRVIPMGGQGKDAFRIIALLGVIALAMAAPALTGTYAGFYGAMVMTTPGMAALTTGVISILGSLRANSLLPARRR